jgi:hypothetical protein
MISAEISFSNEGARMASTIYENIFIGVSTETIDDLLHIIMTKAEANPDIDFFEAVDSSTYDEMVFGYIETRILPEYTVKGWVIQRMSHDGSYIGDRQFHPNYTVIALRKVA